MTTLKKARHEAESESPGKRRGKGRIGKIFRWVIVMFFLGALGGGGTLTGYFFHLKKDLPQISSLKDYRPSVITTVFSDDGKKIGEFFKERRIVVPLNEIPGVLKNAFIAAEDARFYKHKGIDVISVIRAAFKNIEAGSIVQGGSTITQQVTKSFLLTPERSYIRKIKEAILAYRIDQRFTKAEILYLYLNQIYLGHGAYGVEAASENYFGKSAKDINLAEAAMLAGLPQAPSNYSPFRFPERAKKRQLYVLKRMREEGYITEREEASAINVKLDIKPRQNLYIEKVPFYTEYVRRYIETEYGVDVLYKSGLNIYTAVNIDMQEIAQTEVEKGLRELAKRQGYKGALKKISRGEIPAFCQDVQNDLKKNPLAANRVVKGVVIEVDDNQNKVAVRIGNSLGVIALEDMMWARKPDVDVAYYERKVNHPGEVLQTGNVIQVRIKGRLPAESSALPEDTSPGTGENSSKSKIGMRVNEPLWVLSLEEEPEAEAALLCMETETGHVKVIVGGRDFRKNQFNRAIQSRRQPGSAFKPIIYAAALDKGYTPASIIIDSPVILEGESDDTTWKPKNYGQKFYGPTLFRTALAKSRNVVTIKILSDIGIDYAIDYAKRLGITSPIDRYLSIALGSSGVSLLEIVSAYSVFANLGELVQPLFILKIEDRDGNVFEENSPSRTRVIDKSTAYLMTSLLQSVVEDGTGYRAKELNRPVAAKTGTTNNLFDAWFVGYTPDYVVGVWVGYDSEKSLGKGETGARAASPIWVGFMKKILADAPEKGFQVPEGIVFSKIDAETGLLPIPESKTTIFECFKEGTVPTEYTRQPELVIEKEDFFKSGM